MSLTSNDDITCHSLKSTLQNQPKIIMKTKNELTNWLREVSEAGNSVYVTVNGGGICLIVPDEIENLIADINDEDYGEIEILEKGQEYEDFRATMSEEEYEGTENFVLVPHDTGYNQENFDIQIQHYTL